MQDPPLRLFSSSPVTIASCLLAPPSDKLPKTTLMAGGISRFCVNLLETLEDKDTEDSELPIPQNIVENMTAKQEKWNNTTKCITKIMHKKEKTRIKAYVVFHN
ncbi:unnamed protein product [Psylliodes chrysocephalus]|uniref:Uncharacterized protein n=1 Tax=Psylliodes chrysocephalus TaxID=3402493 RepID=A0A9P0D2Q4_9CUCU|nr:unnamed protein product [Psylliodes chrysocephala]